MRRRKRRYCDWILVASSAAGILGCSSAPAPDSLFSVESAGARATLDRLIAADNASDLSGVIDCFESEAILVPPTGEPIRGRTAIEEHYRRLFARERLEVRLEIDETLLARSTATLHGRRSGRRVPLDGGAPVNFSDVFTATMQRAPDQVWRVLSLEWKSVR